ncbi:MAG TPA: alcohol dehydrogenase catalytic domain-containing protein [Blastocatellia bacterium]|nr:alcohol dehydrogenase catalytic domain-containing protein [Blastocatellia bacterium]
MQALVVTDSEKFELADIPTPTIKPHDVLIKVGAVGLCGTDFHIYEGRANYNTDSAGRIIPLSEQPQILGHEFCGTVVEIGTEVSDLKIGDRVVVDQGLNCSSRDLSDWCEYCVTGNTHQCANYAEHGLTGLQGAMAEFIAMPAKNAVRIESDLSLEEAALAEPLGCVVHSNESMQRASARYTFGGERPIKAVLICGAGPAGLLFTQYLRNVIGYAGLLIVSEPNAGRRALVEGYGADVALDPLTTDLVEAVRELTKGERVNYLIESAGVASIFKQIPGLLRKQGTLLMYGHGHHGVDLGVMNNIQFLEPTLLSPCGASGAIDADGRPRTYRQALEMLSHGLINVSRLVTHRYHGLSEIPRAFEQERFHPDYIKGVAVLGQ